MPFLDEDRLYENIEEKYKFAQGEARKAYSDVLDTICEMPSADVEVVRHGHWEFRYDGAYGRRRCYCSYCGEHSGIGGIRKNQLKPYCPNCVARMDGKE